MVDQMDALGIVWQFLSYQEQFRMMWALEMTNQKHQSDHVKLFLNSIGMKLLKRRVEMVYEPTVDYLKTITWKYRKHETWVQNEKLFNELVEFYTHFVQLWKLEEGNESIMKQMLHSVDVCDICCRNDECLSLFGWFRRICLYEIELIRHAFQSFTGSNVPFDYHDIGEDVIEISVNVYGEVGSGKRSMVQSYMLNTFEEDSKFDICEIHECMLMINGNVVKLCIGGDDISKIREKKAPKYQNSIIYCYDVAKLASMVSSAEFKKLVLQDIEPGLIRTILQFPLTPIAVIFTKIDKCYGQEQKFHIGDDLIGTVFHKFPHLVNVLRCSSLTQEGLKSVFDNAVLNGLASRERKIKQKKCTLQ